MRFAEPDWLWIGAVALVVLFALRVRSEILTRRALVRLSSARLLQESAVPSRFRRWLRTGIVCLAVASGFVALARPQKGMSWQTLDRKGTDLLLVVDTSKSMDADDVSPTRLERTKLAIQDLVARFPQDRIGLMAFAGDAYLESPLTLDHGALIETLESFDTSTISQPGTDIGRAIDSGVAVLRADASNQKVMVLLTDGEDLQGQGLAAAKRAAAAGVTIHTVGVGTPAGELVPAKNDEGATVGVLRDAAGTPVRSRLDEPGLRALAQATHGTYRPLGADGGGLERLYTEALAPLARVQKGARLRRVYAEWFAIPLSLSLFGIVLDSLLAFRPRRRAPSSRSARASLFHAGASGAAGAAAALVALLLPASAHASVQAAQRDYQAGKFDAAAKQYASEHAKHPNDARLLVDAGAAAYRAGHFDVAESSLNQALAVAEPKLQERVLYDLGDARYRLGESTLKDTPDKTIARWKASIASYDGALKLRPTDADARFNRDFVQRKLAELEKKQNQDKQKPPPQSSNQDQKGKPQNQGGSGKKGGDSGGDQKQNSSGNQGQKQDNSGNQGQKQDNSGNQGQKPGQSSTGNSPPKDAQDKGQQPNPASPNGQEPTAPKPSGTNPQQQGQGSAGDSAGKDDGKLSARDARALLNSLRGDERQVRFGKPNSKAVHDDDNHGKDW